MTRIEGLLLSEYKISQETFHLGEAVEKNLKQSFDQIEKIKEYNFYKVLLAMKKVGLSDQHFNWTTGYGYSDLGREKIDALYAEVFKTEDAIVRSSFANGTHVLGLCLKSLLKQGDGLVSVTGKPYDTLDEIIGLKGDYQKSLMNQGIDYQEISFLQDGSLDFKEIEKTLEENPNIKMIYVQRSTGYHFRQALTIENIKKVVTLVKSINPSVICMVDNCYGEFLERREPTEVGVDLLAGSLIKNPGGGIALSGGYIAGKETLIKLIAQEHTMPGIERECGLTFGQSRSLFQGLFLAPNTVSQAIKSAVFCGALFQKAGYEVKPDPLQERSDIIQSIRLGSREKVLAFCEAIQEVAPVDAFVKPEPWDMPGYSHKIIMAAGTFIQGSSIELSADAPIKEPYIVYFQGGLDYAHGKIGALKALENLKK
ncbi:methionine gamma-lyase family protein [Isachenkonia alkalipeptolytica]|uniref:Aluminum resistance protein n=1 Tax=Isachenkonia alkalipeptolytica TaxID=2565777 RepID=A0AA43XLV8_9CLOT|nr:methionine gamma-lyase family protein [Isachenkonia alkalipeptolytica]NBG88746.1 hypothetical protein [Isachenkonia alkalipeptolytica]